MDPHFLSRCAAAAACMFVSASSLLAQAAPEPRANGGLWWSASVAVAGARLTCDICDPSRDGGPSIELAGGVHAGDRVRVGMDGGVWTFHDEDFRERVYTAGMVAEVHPRPGSGLHLIGGLGWTGYRAHDVDPADLTEGFHYDAVRLRLGAGWDLPFTSSWVVGNRLTLDASSLGTLHDEGAPIARSVGLSVVRFGIYVRRR